MKIKLFAMLAALVLIAVACSSGTETTTEPAADVPDETEAMADPIVIDMWIAFTDEARLGFAEAKAAAFNEAHPDYEVKIQAFDSYNTVFEQAQLALDGGTPPAIIHFFEAATQEALDAVAPDGHPVFKSVTEATAGRTEILGEKVVLDEVVSAAKNYYTIDGEFYSMPWNTSSAIMFSNMDLLNAAGVTAPPETWDEVTAACEKVAAMADGPTGCITWPNHSWFVEQSLGQQGELLANNDNGRTARADEVFLDSDGMQAYFEWWKSLDDAGYYTYTGVQRDWNGTASAFSAQEVAMLIYSSSDTTVLTEDGAAAGFDVVASRMPYNSDVPFEGNLIGGATLWLLDDLDTATEDGALAFMNFFSNDENASEWHQITGYIPITEGAIADLEDHGWYEENPNSAVASEQLAMAADTPAARGALLGNFVAIRDVITAAAEDMLVNDVDIAERLALADADAQKLLDEYTALFGG